MVGVLPEDSLAPARSLRIATVQDEPAEPGTQGPRVPEPRRGEAVQAPEPGFRFCTCSKAPRTEPEGGEAGAAGGGVFGTPSSGHRDDL